MSRIWENKNGGRIRITTFYEFEGNDVIQKLLETFPNVGAWHDHQLEPNDGKWSKEIQDVHKTNIKIFFNPLSEIDKKQAHELSDILQKTGRVKFIGDTFPIPLKDGGFIVSPSDRIVLRLVDIDRYSNNI